MSKPLKKVSIDKNIYNVVGKSRIFRLSDRHLIEEGDFVYNPSTDSLTLLSPTTTRESTQEPLEIAAFLMNNNCKLYKISAGNYMRCTDISHVNIAANTLSTTFKDSDGTLINVEELYYIP